MQYQDEMDAEVLTKFRKTHLYREDRIKTIIIIICLFESFWKLTGNFFGNTLII